MTASSPSNNSRIQLAPDTLSLTPGELYPLIGVRDHGSHRAALGVMTPEMCAGHFPRHPCVPVALLLQSSSHAAGELFSLRTGSLLTSSRAPR